MKYHIDTDMGVDDGLALVLASKLIDVCAISTTFGNVDVETATRNALIFRMLLGRDASWKVWKGAKCARDGFHLEVPDIHGIDGLGGATRDLDDKILSETSAADVLLLADASRPGLDSITLIGIGPATNIPSIVSLYGRSAVKRIVLMSGAFFDVGNITPFSEFNAHNDPFALKEILKLRIPVTFVPLDVCRKIQITRNSMEQYGKIDKSELAQLLSKSHMWYMDFYRRWEGIDGCFPHDAIAILVALKPDEFVGVTGRVSVDCSVEFRGKTRVFIRRSSKTTIITGGNLKWAREEIQRMLSGAIAESVL